MGRFDNSWTAEKVSKNLEATGFLEHFLLLLSIEQPMEFCKLFKENPLEYLLPCTAFIKKRFKKGTPCGDTVRKLVEQGDGHASICQFVLPYFTFKAWSSCQHRFSK
jgi:hypothetical protein